MNDGTPAERVVADALAVMRHREKCVLADARVSELESSVERARLAGVLHTPAGQQALSVWNHHKQIAARLRAGKA